MSLVINIFLQKSLSKADQLHFAQQLLSLLHAGLPLLNALELLTQSAPKSWQSWLLDTRSLIKKGNSFSQSLHVQEIRLSAEFINLIRVSERSGDLPLALKTICQQLEAQIELRRKVQQSLAYPLITLTSSFFLVLVMMIWVIPVFKEVFRQFQAELPAPTRALITISTVIENYYLEIFTLILISVGLFAFLWLKSIYLQKQCDRWSLQIPFVGNLLRLATLTNWCRTLGHLLHSGLPLPDA